jgi:hypothetical protein
MLEAIAALMSKAKAIARRRRLGITISRLELWSSFKETGLSPGFWISIFLPGASEAGAFESVFGAGDVGGKTGEKNFPDCHLLIYSWR